MNVETDKIVLDLNRRFAAPLPEFYERRIIFWHDEEKEYADKLDEIRLENAKLVALTGSNTFEVKKMLSVDDLTSNYVVYCPISYERQEDDWLLDIELYSESYRTDAVSNWMQELDILDNPSMRKLVKHYRKFFGAQARRAKIMAQDKIPATPAQLHMAVMAALCGMKKAQPNEILLNVLRGGLDKAQNPIYQSFVDYGAEEAFWAMVRQGCGYAEEEPDLGQLAIHLLLTASTRTLRPEFLAGLEKFLSIPHQAYCYELVSEWLHSDDLQQLYDVARYVEDEAHLSQRLEKLTVDDLTTTECFPCINEIILSKLMTEISDHIIDVDVITKTVEKRRTCVWYEYFRNFYEGLLQVANMQEFFKEHSAGFHTPDAKQVWKEYAEDYYRMDTYYRLFHLSFQRSLETSNIKLDDLFKHVVDKVEGLYSYWFLGASAKTGRMYVLMRWQSMAAYWKFRSSRISTMSTSVRQTAACS